MRVLIVEDERILSSVLKDQFEEEGFDALTAMNGQVALDILKSKSGKIDVVLLDLLLPVMDGFAVLEEMHKDTVNNLAAIPVIVLSNLGQDEEIKRALNLGAVDYFVKSQHPISEVIEKVKLFLEKNGLAKKIVKKEKEEVKKAVKTNKKVKK